MSIFNPNSVGLNSPDPYVSSVLQSVTQPLPTAKAPSKFRQVLGGIAAGVGNMVMPGVGGAIGNLIAGGSSLTGAGSLLGGQAGQMLQYQAQMLQEQQSFELASTILKNRNDAAMSAIRNMKAS